MPVCCFGNQNQEQIVQQVQSAQSAMMQPIVVPMPIMNVCAPQTGYGIPQNGIIGNGYTSPPQGNAAVPAQTLPNGINYGYGMPQGVTQPIASGIIGNGYNAIPQSAYGYEQTQTQPQAQIPPGGITINITNSQDKNSKNTATKSEMQSAQPYAMMQQAQQPRERVVQRHIIERKPFFITKNHVRTQLRTKTYYKEVRVPVQIEKDKFVYVNRFIPYNACEGATPHNVNNGFV